MRSRAGRKSKGNRKWSVSRADLAGSADCGGREVSALVGLFEYLRGLVVVESMLVAMSGLAGSSTRVEVAF